MFVLKSIRLDRTCRTTAFEKPQFPYSRVKGSIRTIDSRIRSVRTSPATSLRIRNGIFQPILWCTWPDVKNERPGLVGSALARARWITDPRSTWGLQCPVWPNRAVCSYAETAVRHPPRPLETARTFWRSSRHHAEVRDKSTRHLRPVLRIARIIPHGGSTRPRPLSLSRPDNPSGRFFGISPAGERTACRTEIVPSNVSRSGRVYVFRTRHSLAAPGCLFCNARFRPLSGTRVKNAYEYNPTRNSAVYSFRETTGPDIDAHRWEGHSVSGTERSAGDVPCDRPAPPPG